MLAIARERLPDVPFHHGDMTDFDLGKQFDVVTCLFSAIAHLRTRANLNAAVNCMARHLKSGGVLIVEPFITPDQWREGTVSTDFVPEKRVVRFTRSTRHGNLAQLEMHHFAEWDERSGAATYFLAQHDMALYTIEDYIHAYGSAGLDVIHDEEGLMGRGLFIGVRNA